MKIIASQLCDSVLCTLPNGEHIEVEMLCLEGDDFFAEPNVERAINIVVSYVDLDI